MRSVLSAIGGFVVGVLVMFASRHHPPRPPIVPTPAPTTSTVDSTTTTTSTTLAPVTTTTTTPPTVHLVPPAAHTAPPTPVVPRLVAAPTDPCAAAVAWIAAHGAPGFSTVCGRHVGAGIPMCAANRSGVVYGCTLYPARITYIACPLPPVYHLEAENQRYFAGLRSTIPYQAVAASCATGNPLGA